MTENSDNQVSLSACDNVAKKLSVIVPMYNVQDFLSEALESILNQNLSENEIQVILIDDGSNDETLQIAKRYVTEYPKVFELYQFFNYGAGKIRNYGIEIAKGDYITFLDADDVIENNAYETAIKHIEKTHSDILLGRVKRFNSKRSWLSEIHSAIPINEVKDSIGVAEEPKLVYYTTAWDKVYNLDFLRKYNIKFSEGKIYEDIPFTNAAYVNATSIDITDIPFYKWRSRDNGQKSDTQRTDDIQPLLDRYVALEETFDRLVRDNVSKINLDFFLKKAFSFDIPVMFKRLNHIELIAESELNIVYVATKNILEKFEFKENNFGVSITELAFLNELVNSKTQVAFFKVVKSYVRQEINVSGKWIDNKWTLMTDISAITKIATADDFKITTKVQKAILGSELLMLEGFVFAEHSDMSKLDNVQNPTVSLFDANHKLLRTNCGHVSFFKNDKITARYGYNSNHFVKDGADFNYNYSGYKIEIPVQELFANTSSITLQLSFEVNGQYVTTMISDPISGSSPRPQTHVYQDMQMALDIKYYRPTWNLVIHPKGNIPIVSYENFKFQISKHKGKVYLKKGSELLPLHSFFGKLIFPKKVNNYLNQNDKNVSESWQMVTKRLGIIRPVYFPQDTVEFSNDKSLRFLTSVNGQAVLERPRNYSRILNAKVNKGTLNITFELLGWEKEITDVTVRADVKSPNIIWATKKNAAGCYELELPLTLDKFGKKEWLNFQVVVKFADGHEKVVFLKWGNRSFELENTKLSINNVEWEFRRISRNGGAFAIKRTADRVYREEIGSFAKFLETDYQQLLKEPLLEDTIVWSAYWGRNNNFNGNPRALYDYVSQNYSNFKNIIVIKDVIHSFEGLKKHTKVISFGTKEYWYYLAKAKYFVNDVNFTQNERKKREDQIEIQTMHGTPLKTMGFNVLSEWTDGSYNKMYKRFTCYDYLVVPSDWVSEYATQAFHVHPKLLKTGYPRNDVFFEKHSVEELNGIKKRLNLPLNKKIVLYTPTYRNKNDEVSLNQRFNNLDSLYDTLSDDKILVIKNHNFEKYRNIPKKYRDKFFLIDPYENINDLYIISDMLITDYSSVMFDYALLKKPMIFWAFDYESYVEERGINFDLKNEAPGPFVQSQNELETWITNYQKISDVYSKNIDSFIDKFGQYDEGNASQQIADIIWGSMKG